MDKAFELSDISKTYGKIRVLHGIDLSVHSGRCLALLGQNGAGKSTLINIVSGITRPTSGTVNIDGDSVSFARPRDALRRGIAVIPQELAYAPDMSVAENICIGKWPHRCGITSQRRIASLARREAEPIGITVPFDTRMRSLTLAQRQLVEIVKILSERPRLILLDEPTAALSAADADRLLSVLADLKRAGHAMVYVSHRFDECLRIADDVAVLRNGRLVLNKSIDEVEPNEVIDAMLGEQVQRAEAAVKTSRGGTSAVLSVERLTIPSKPPVEVSFDVREREIVGLFGLVGSGVEVVGQALAGRVRAVDGQVTVCGKSRRPFRTPPAADAAGVAYVPAERKTQGLALNQSITSNITVGVTGKFASLGVMRKKSETRRASELATEFGVRYQRLGQPVSELSGGNQQKVLLASRFAKLVNVAVLHEPTRGVDVGARRDIHEILRSRAQGGACILLITSDVEEVVSVSDRVLVMRSGGIVAELSGADCTEARVIGAAAGIEAHHAQ